MPDDWIGGGELGLAFGARGHGNASAHYEQDLHVINLTRFNGAGSIAHEVFHSLDARMSRQWFNHQGLLSNLLTSYKTPHLHEQHIQYDRFRAFKEIVAASTSKTDFVQSARNIEGQKGTRKYWTKPSELCARAFESYIEHKSVDMGLEAQWLASGTKQDDYPHNGMHPYPTGKERHEIFQIYEQNALTVFSDL